MYIRFPTLPWAAEFSSIMPTSPCWPAPSNPLDCGTGGRTPGCITTNTSGNATLRVPYLGFSTSGIGVDQTISDSHFNSLQATVTKRFSHGMQMQAAYTWARGFTTASYIAYNNADLPLVYGPMPFLRPQRLTVNYTYDLPFGKHEGILDKVASGWNLSGVTTVQNGVPLTITDANGGNIYAAGGGNQTSTAQLCGCGVPVATSGSDKSRLGGALSAQPWINIAAFTKFASTTNNGYGNSGYGIVPGPGQFNWDISLVKTTKVGGYQRECGVGVSLGVLQRIQPRSVCQPNRRFEPNLGRYLIHLRADQRHVGEPAADSVRSQVRVLGRSNPYKRAAFARPFFLPGRAVSRGDDESGASPEVGGFKNPRLVYSF